jgi:hypothetical protein
MTTAADPIACLATGPGIDGYRNAADLKTMTRSITIIARWDDEAGVWLATSEDVAGLVVEAETWANMIEEVRMTLPDLLELSGQSDDSLSLTFRAEQHLDLARA